MRKQILFLIFLGLSSSIAAQKAWQNELTVGFGHAKIEKNYVDYPLTSLRMEFNKIYNGQPEKRISWIEELGVGLKYNSLSWENGGMGGNDHHSGAYFYSTLNLAFLSQFRLGENYLVQFGPRGEINLMGYESSKFDWWRMENFEHETRQVSGNQKTSEFNRNYFKYPYYGLSFRLMNKPKDTGRSAGLELSCLWTKSSPSNFNTKRMIQLGFVIQL